LARYDGIDAHPKLMSRVVRRRCLLGAPVPPALPRPPRPAHRFDAQGRQEAWGVFDLQRAAIAGEIKLDPEKAQATIEAPREALAKDPPPAG
jgi:hypothetical protein